MNRDKLKKICNIYNTVIRTAKKFFGQTQIQNNCNDLHKTWQLLSKAIRKTKNNKENCTSLTINDTSINDPSLMAESFNTFFATAALNVVNKINPSNKSATANIPVNDNLFSLKNSPVTITEILEATKLLQDKKNT